MKLRATKRGKRFNGLTKILLAGSLLLAIPAVAACESGSDAVSDQINQQVEGLQEQAGDVALDQLNEATGGQVEELQRQKEEALQQLDQAQKEANQAINEARRQAEQAGNTNP